LNNGGKLREKLTLVYPKEGVSTADYPFMLLQEPRRADYVKVVAYLKGREAQNWLARQTLRRPIVAEVAAEVADLFPKEGAVRVELAFSPDRQLADGLIDAYLNEFRRPIASTFVLDTSGSMEREGRRQQLVQAIHYISGADNSLTGRLAKLTDREKVWMQPFSDQPGPVTFFEVPAARGKGRGVKLQEDSQAKQEVLGRVRDYAEQLRMTGGTALYDSVLRALEHMVEEKKKNPDYQYSVVAFTDGENNAGRNLQAFQQAYAQLPEDVRGIPVFMVLFGEAKESELKALVQTTGGRTFDAGRRRSMRCSRTSALINRRARGRVGKDRRAKDLRRKDRRQARTASVINQGPNSRTMLQKLARFLVSPANWSGLGLATLVLVLKSLGFIGIAGLPLAVLGYAAGFVAAGLWLGFPRWADLAGTATRSSSATTAMLARRWAGRCAASAAWSSTTPTTGCRRACRPRSWSFAVPSRRCSPSGSAARACSRCRKASMPGTSRSRTCPMR
jgi:Mg-chelatase subunit ChlD